MGRENRSQVPPPADSRPRLAVAGQHTPAFDSLRKQSSLLALLATTTAESPPCWVGLLLVMCGQRESNSLQQKPPQCGGFCYGAGRENRTLIYCLEGSHSTTKLCPQRCVHRILAKNKTPCNEGVLFFEGNLFSCSFCSFSSRSFLFGRGGLFCCLLLFVVVIHNN